MGRAAAAGPARAGRKSRPAHRPRGRRVPPPPVPLILLELHLGRDVAARRRLEERLLLEAAQGGDEARREDSDAEIVVTHRLVETLALHGDAVLRALELALQGEE